MDFGNPGRTASATGLPAVSRSDIVAPRGSVAVELPPEQTVQSAEAGSPVQIDIRARQRDAQTRRDAQQRDKANEVFVQRADRSRDEVVERRTIIDPQTRAVVLQKRDTETGETVSQLPDETLLKLRAYSRELEERAREKEGEPPHQVERRA